MSWLGRPSAAPSARLSRATVLEANAGAVPARLGAVLGGSATVGPGAQVFTSQGEATTAGPQLHALSEPPIATIGRSDCHRGRRPEMSMRERQHPCDPVSSQTWAADSGRCWPPRASSPYYAWTRQLLRVRVTQLVTQFVEVRQGQQPFRDRVTRSRLADRAFEPLAKRLPTCPPDVAAFIGKPPNGPVTNSPARTPRMVAPSGVPPGAGPRVEQSTELVDPKQAPSQLRAEDTGTTALRSALLPLRVAQVSIEL